MTGLTIYIFIAPIECTWVTPSVRVRICLSKTWLYSGAFYGCTRPAEEERACSVIFFLLVHVINSI